MIFYVDFHRTLQKETYMVKNRFYTFFLKSLKILKYRQQIYEEPINKIRRPLRGNWRVRVSFRHSDFLTLPLPPPARARGPTNRSVYPPPPPTTPAILLDLLPEGTIHSTKITPRVSQGHWAAPRSPLEDQQFQFFFFFSWVVKNSTILGSRFVDSLHLWEVWAESFF